MIFAFNHEHEPGDVCSAATCEFARAKPSLVGTDEEADVVLFIRRKATQEEYETQPLPEDWVLPPCVYNCNFFYEVSSD